MRAWMDGWALCPHRQQYDEAVRVVAQVVARVGHGLQRHCARQHLAQAGREDRGKGGGAVRARTTYGTEQVPFDASLAL